MRLFFTELKKRNILLFQFGKGCLLLACLFLVLSQLTDIKIYGVNAWYKPFKFALSTTIFSWTLAWYLSYLPNFKSPPFSWTIILCLGFEIGYIAIQASKGQTSHYNSSTPLHTFFFMAMIIAATLVSLYVLYIGVRFMKADFPTLPDYYVLAIRFSLFLFVLFSFQGFVMGQHASHTIGAMNDNSSLPILGWSMKYGDLRLAHFWGMHALQFLPITSFYLIKNKRAVYLFGFFYLLLGIYLWVIALQGKSLFQILHFS